MECSYKQRNECNSCTWLNLPYPDQISAKQNEIDALFASVPGLTDNLTWLEPATSAPEHFRTKAKMAVGGTVDAPTLGILDRDFTGIDLRTCPITDPFILAALPGISRFITEATLVPYNVTRRVGELKYVLVTAAHDGHLMVRFVLRSKRMVTRIRVGLDRLGELVDSLDVVTANIHPRHAALVEGDEEIVLTDTTTLTMRVGDVTLHLGPRSFSQTNTAVASALYRQAGVWTNSRGRPHSLWDLYCGVGGFALHAAHSGVGQVTGVEISPQAIRSARRSAGEQGFSAGTVNFVSADATTWALAQHQEPDFVVVNPPRRGIGDELAHWLEVGRMDSVIYSSCNPRSLVRDLQQMPSLHPVEGRLFDMFPHTGHAEVAVLLQR